MQDINSWSDAGSWQSIDALNLASIPPRLEAIRKAIIERAELFELSTATIANTPHEPDAIRPFLLNCKEILLQLIPKFARITENKIFALTLESGSGQHQFNDVNLNNFSFAENGDGYSDELTITAGYLNLSSSKEFTYENVPVVKLLITPWTSQDLATVVPLPDPAPLADIRTTLWNFYRILCLLGNPLTSITLHYQSNYNTELFQRLCTQFMYELLITYSTPSRVEVMPSPRLSSSELWGLSQWMPRSGNVVAKMTRNIYTVIDSAAGINREEIYRDAYRTQFKNLSCSNLGPLPLQFSYWSFLEAPGTANYNSEIGARNTWYKNIELSLGENGISVPYEFGMLDTLPDAGLWIATRKKSVISFSHDVLNFYTFAFQ